MIDSRSKLERQHRKVACTPSSSFPQGWHLTSYHSQQADTGPMCVQFSALLNTCVAWHNAAAATKIQCLLTAKISLSVVKPTHPNPGMTSSLFPHPYSVVGILRMMRKLGSLARD